MAGKIGDAIAKVAALHIQEMMDAGLPEGWCLSWSTDYGTCIEKDDDAGTFKYDDDAIAHVAERARAGSQVHLMAMQVHADSNAEYWSVTLPERLMEAGK
jgi:hypothetical protein